VDRCRKLLGRKNYANIGAQVDLRFFSVLHWYEMTLSAGYAVVFARAARRSEWMLSLKIM